MMKLASFALISALGVAGIAASQSAAACAVEGGYRGAEFVRPIGYFPEHFRPYYAHDRYRHHDYWRDGRFHRDWDRRQ